MENLKKICVLAFKQQKGEKHGHNSHSCCCYSHCYHSAFDCHYHQKDDKEDIYLRDIRPDYRTTFGRNCDAALLKEIPTARSAGIFLGHRLEETGISSIFCSKRYRRCQYF